MLKSIHTEYDSAISAHSSVTELSHLAVIYNRDSGMTPALDHFVYQLPLSVEGVELQDVINEGTVRAA